jgi:hypothetical protein
MRSFTMLTINAGHMLKDPFHNPTDEKRMIMILPHER